MRRLTENTVHKDWQVRRIIGITPEQDVFRERERIINMLRSGEITYFHIRKPYYNENRMREYLSFFPYDVRKRLALNDFQYLADEYGIGGIHINKRFDKTNTKTDNKRISVSCHTIKEVADWKNQVDYCFLSPIFDSISKQDYQSKFSFEELKTVFKQNILTDKVIALGGVTFNNLNTLKEIGFSQFAMLSSLWMLPKTMFISHFNDRYDYISGSIAALSGGIRFIQLRMKDVSDEEVLKTAKVLREECDKHSALLTVDDRIHLLETNLFDGVHLGKNDMPISEAKKITRDKFLLGATCNTVEDVKKAVNDGADYLGIGPFRFTHTKKNLATVLGLDGYKKINGFMQQNKMNIPVYAIGGITTEDLSDLSDTGIYGVAASGVILNNSQETINKFLEIF